MIAGFCRLVSVVATTTALLLYAMASETIAAPREGFLIAQSESPKSCAEATEQSKLLNGSELFQASASCFREERHFEGTFLLIAGQTRSMTDMSLLPPLDDADEIVVAELYGTIFFQTGGAGYDEFYRDSVLTQKLFSQLEEWSPSFFDGYDPGWKYKTYKLEAKPGWYEQTATNLMASRLAQLRWYAELMGREDYYAAHKELAELQNRNPEGIHKNSEDGNRVDELRQAMHRISQEIPMLKPESSDAFHFVPDPDADYEQLLVGWNGPASGGVFVLESEEEVSNSWLPKAVGQSELTEILSKMDFENQIVIAFAVGERTTVTGALFVTDVSYNAIHESLSVAVRIGVNEMDCDLPPTKSYPFALAVAKRPPQVPKYPGQSTANFGDGCKQPKSSEATYWKR